MKNNQVPLLTLIAGVALNGVWLLSFTLSSATGFGPVLPAFCGGLFIVLGGISLFNAKLRPHLIHSALLLALLLAIFSVYQMVGLLQAPTQAPGTVAADAERQGALKMLRLETTAAVCLAYLAMGIASFRKARRLRRAQNDIAPDPTA